MKYEQSNQFTCAHEQMDIPDNISEIEQAPANTHKKQLLPSEPHIFGALHINYLLYFFVPLAILTPCYTYHVAVKHKEQRPYPHSTITNTACFYPQDIIFRWIMLSSGSFITLIYFGIFRWLVAEKKRTKYPGDTYKWLFPVAQASITGFLAAIGTIDGAGYPDLHTYGAVFFFVTLFITAVTVTLVLTDMHQWDTTVLNRSSYISKSIFAVACILLVLYCAIGFILQIK